MFKVQSEDKVSIGEGNMVKFEGFIRCNSMQGRCMILNVLTVTVKTMLRREKWENVDGIGNVDVNLFKGCMDL